MHECTKQNYIQWREIQLNIILDHFSFLTRATKTHPSPGRNLINMA